MQKQAIRSLIRNTLPKYDKVNSFHDLFLDAAIEKVLMSLYNEAWQIDPLSLQRYIKQYGYVTPIAVNTEATTGIKYSTLPESIVVIGDKASGVRRISTITQGALKFIPMDMREFDLLANGAYYNAVTSFIGYSVNQTRIEYYGMTNAIQAVGVRMDMLVPFSKYSETDEVKIPEIDAIVSRGGDGMMTFVGRVMAILGIVQPTDLMDNNAPRDGRGERDN